MSLDSTKKYIRYIRDTFLSEEELKLLFGVGPILAFAIATTGCMSDIIASFSNQAQTLINNRVGTNDKPILYVLVPFNDPDLGTVTTTCGANTFIEHLGYLQRFFCGSRSRHRSLLPGISLSNFKSITSEEDA
jgi:von Willebrand factor A domain-containing protein 7